MRGSSVGVGALAFWWRVVTLLGSREVVRRVFPTSRFAQLVGRRTHKVKFC